MIRILSMNSNTRRERDESWGSTQSRAPLYFILQMLSRKECFINLVYKIAFYVCWVCQQQKKKRSKIWPLSYHMHDANYELIKTYFSVHFGSSSLFVSARFLWQAAGMKEEPRESWENKYFFLYFWLSPLRIISITHWTLFSLWVSMQSYNQDFQWNFIPSSASFSYYKIALSLSTSFLA